MYTKKSIFEWATYTKSDFLHYDVRKIFLQIPREELLKKIDTDWQNVRKRFNE